MVVLKDALTKFSETIKKDKDKWKFLLLTGKIENHFRDELAWAIQKDVRPNTFVFRDRSVKGKRPDLCFTSDPGGKNIEYVIELKHYYSFDSGKHRGPLSILENAILEVEGQVNSYEAKNRYGIFLLTHFDIDYTNENHTGVKYANHARGLLKDKASAGKLTEASCVSLKRYGLIKEIDFGKDVVKGVNDLRLAIYLKKF